MKKNITLFTFFSTFCLLLNAQNMTSKIQDFADKTKASITFNAKNETVSFIKFPSESSFNNKGNSAEAKAISFIETSRLFGDLKSDKFKIKKVETDNYGFKHVTLSQTKNGIPVFDGVIRFHFDVNKRISAINSNLIHTIKVNTDASISKNSANTIALTAVKNQELTNNSDSVFIHNSDLVIFPKGRVQGENETNYLAYYIEVRNDLDIREYLFVDAHSGKVIEQFTGMAHALDRIVYEGNINPANIVWEEGDPLPGTLTIWQQNEVIASEHTYNFFKNAFNYISYDGADAQMVTINNNPNINCPNANWNGVSANYCNGTASDDLIAHEWGHAYTEYTNNLIYAWQSGAINEAYSDIWGETIDLLNNYEDTGEDLSLRNGCDSSDRWQIGEDASAFGAAIRDMWDPPCKGDPGNVSGPDYFCGTGDSGGVHINSGVPNKAYAFLVDGGTFNGYTIPAIGFTKAAHVFWRAQSLYLTATSDFVDLADGLEASATDLLNIDLQALSTEATPTGLSGQIITATDVQTIKDVILAVEMRTNPDACNFQPLLTNAPTPCEASSSNPIFREDWETGTDGWTFTQIPTNPSTWENRDWVLDTNLPDERTGNAIFGSDPIIGDCQTDLENGIMRLESPVITIPNYVTGNTEMFFNHYVSTEATWDGGNIKYSLDGGAWEVLPASAFTTNPYNGNLRTIAQGNDNPMESEAAFTGTDGGTVQGSWGTSIVDLSSINVIENSTIQFRFEMGTDGCNGRIGWYIDELAVYNYNFALSTTEFTSLAEVIKVYPNPSSGIFNIRKTNQVDLIKANIYDINGRLIKKIDLKNMNVESQLNISSAAIGLYFIELHAENTKHVFKVLKN